MYFYELNPSNIVIPGFDNNEGDRFSGYLVFY